MSKTKLGEIADITKLAGFEFTKYIKYNDNGEIIALRALNLRNGQLDLSDIKRIDRSVSESLSRSKLYKNDILLTYTGNGYGDCAIIEENDKYHLAPNICKLTPNLDKVDPYYLYSVLRDPSFRILMSNYVTGSGQPTIPMKTIRVLEVECPTISAQRKIGQLIKCLDDRIRVNTEINQNLLHQVTAFFHDYFDEYEFSTEDTMLLGDVARFKYGTMPKKDKLGSGEYVAFSGYQVVGSYPERMFSDPQLIVVARGVGGCGDIKYTPADCYLTNLSIAILTSSIAMEDYLFNYLRLHDTKVMNTGSAQPQITVSTLEKYQLPIPPLDRLQSFSALVQPYKSMYRKNKDENERLQMLRDTLLPRLMSGELDVSEIEV